ncbi:hypothetical protein F53441_9957 [Fusarium austroafricanum]|uniref:Uncharacterized protein n=1 Tax=Fusarium austroafricanum TaxID=2364996 RepID=A0A8H4KAP6_9HYPO|nr:hypothetical protein F53441_9957 [Fusarium austroafricanum]
MVEPQYHDEDANPKQNSTTQNQDQPQSLTVQDATASPVKDRIWTVRLNLRLFSISVDAILLIIVCFLASGSDNDTTPIIFFGLLTTLALIWSFTDSIHLWARRDRSFSPSMRIYIDLMLSITFAILSLVCGYFGPSDHPTSGAPSKDEPHFGRRALGCFGITKVLIYILLAFVSYYERIQKSSSTPNNNYSRNEGLARDEEERPNTVWYPSSPLSSTFPLSFSKPLLLISLVLPAACKQTHITEQIAGSVVFLFFNVFAIHAFVRDDITTDDDFAKGFELCRA